MKGIQLLCGSLGCHQSLHISRPGHYFLSPTPFSPVAELLMIMARYHLMLMEFLPIISVAKMFKLYFSMWKTTTVLRYKNAIIEYITSISQHKFIFHVLSIWSKLGSNLVLGAGRSLDFLPYHTKSLQTEQNVGCPKKVAINSWLLM